MLNGGVILFSRPESAAVEGQKSSEASVRGIESGRTAFSPLEDGSKGASHQIVLQLSKQ
jgi:hypothetical protein